MISKSKYLGTKMGLHLSPNDSDESEPTSPGSMPEREEKLLVLGRLAEASNYANDCGRNVWDFAVGLNFFIEKGISESAMRWLVCQHYIEHRYEVLTEKDEQRLFYEAPDTVLAEKSCFTISEGGREIFDHLKQADLQNTANHGAVKSENGILPTWCPLTRVLKINDKVVKHFKWPAPNQEKLINAFAEQGWPNRLDDPLPPNNGVCPKRRLHDTIKCLNRNQINKLIKFRGDGTAQGACWEYRSENPDTTD